MKLTCFHFPLTHRTISGQIHIQVDLPNFGRSQKWTPMEKSKMNYSIRRNSWHISHWCHLLTCKSLSKTNTLMVPVLWPNIATNFQKCSIFSKIKVYSSLNFSFFQCRYTRTFSKIKVCSSLNFSCFQCRYTRISFLSSFFFVGNLYKKLKSLPELDMAMVQCFVTNNYQIVNWNLFKNFFGHTSVVRCSKVSLLSFQ